METIEKIAFERLGLIVDAGTESAPELQAIILAELAAVGINVTNPDKLTSASLASIPAFVAHVRQWRGEKGKYSPLFAGFPDKLPAYDDAQARFSVAKARLAGNPAPTEDDIRKAMDFSDILWWPASSVPQDVNATIQARISEELKNQDSLKKWFSVKVISPGELEEALEDFMKTALSVNSSLREDVRRDVKIIGKTYGFQDLNLGEVPFRENRTILLEEIWNAELKTFPKVGATPDDILRLMAQLTETNVSLTGDAKWPKLSRAQRRAIVNALENTPRLSEIFRHRGMWLSLGKALHVGEYNSPKTQDAFHKLRDSRHDRDSVLARFEKALKTDQLEAIELLAQEAPSVLLRQLRRVLALQTKASMPRFLAALEKATKRTPVKILLNVRAQILDNGDSYPRVVFTKTGEAKVIDRQPGHLRAVRSVQKPTLKLLDAAIEDNLSARESWKGRKVFIEPGMEKVVLPEQLRSSAAGMWQAERGSRFPLGEGSVVRLFVHWKGEGADLDLSTIALGSNYEILTHVSWLNLSAGDMVHSGDITSAPLGAEEFIDINVDKAALNGWRYIAAVIFRYSSPKFSELEEANAGWMMRNDCSSRKKTFDAATVSNAFPLTGAGRSAVPILIDLIQKEVVIIDAYLRGMPAAQVATDGLAITNISRLVEERRNLRTSVKQLIDENVLARGAVETATREEAEITFGFDDSFTFNVMRPEKLLSELM